MQTVQQTRTFSSVSDAVYDMFKRTVHSRATIGDKAFRKAILLKAEFEWNCTQASAASMYNNAKKRVTAESPSLVIGLGRAEGKNNGGRRRVVNVEVATHLLGHSTPQEDVIDVEAKVVEVESIEVTPLLAAPEIVAQEKPKRQRVSKKK